MNEYKDPQVHVVGSEIGEDEIKAYIKRAHELHPGTRQLEIHVDGEYVDLRYDVQPFDRIRRIA